MARKPARPVKPSEKPRKTKVTVSLDGETAGLLRSYAGFHNLDLCDVVARALRKELAGFVVYQRQGEADAPPAPAAPEGPQQPRGAVGPVALGLRAS